MSRFDWARQYFAADLQENLQREESLRGLGLGWISGYDGSLTLAIDAFERYLALVPGDSEIRLRLARAWNTAGEAARGLEALGELEESPESVLVAARLHLATSPDLATKLLRRLLAEQPSFEAHYLLAEAQDRLGNDEAAAAAITSAVELNPLSTEAFYLQAQILRRLGQEEAAAEALATFELLNELPGPGFDSPPAQKLAVLRSLEKRLQPTARVFTQRLAMVLLEVGDGVSAQPLVEHLVADPEVGELSLLGLGQAAHGSGRVVIARSLYEAVLARDPENLEALTSRARLAFESNEPGVAQVMVDRGFEVDAHYGPLHFTNGLLALAEKDEPAAISALQRAVELVPWLPRFRLTLADVYWTRGDVDAVNRLLDAAPVEEPAIEAYKARHSLGAESL